MQLALGYLVATVLVLIFHIPSRSVMAGSMRLRLCIPCFGDECNTVPEDDCPYGLVRNSCGEFVCGKGPGEICGGPSKIFGICGDGMHCKCDRCVGCSSKTLDCDLRTSVC